MNLKAAIFDIDGTLVPYGATTPSKETCRALRALRKQGVVVIIATGRALFNAKLVLGEAKADYYACVNGNWVADSAGRTVQENRLTCEEMYALVDFFEDDDLPLNFIFEDGYYAYVEYATYRAIYRNLLADDAFLRDGEDQDRHLQSMPYAASALVEAQRVEAFAQKYGYLGLRFVPFHENHYDILREGTHKGAALTELLQTLNIAWEDTVAFGDGVNDTEMLELAGCGVAMENGAQSLCSIADIVAPAAENDGVAKVVFSLLNEKDV